MKIYVLYTCDAWKSTSSMNCLGASVNLKDIKKELYKMHDAGECDYRWGSLEKKDLKELDVFTLNDSFDYIYVDELESGEFSGQ